MSGNIPYVKQYKDGEVTNPIKGSYVSVLPNRAARRAELRTERFFGNGKSIPLSVTKVSKHKRVRQFIVLKDGSKKIVEHYVE